MASQKIWCTSLAKGAGTERGLVSTEWIKTELLLCRFPCLYHSIFACLIWFLLVTSERPLLLRIEVKIAETNPSIMQRDNIKAESIAPQVFARCGYQNEWLLPKARMSTKTWHCKLSMQAVSLSGSVGCQRNTTLHAMSSQSNRCCVKRYWIERKVGHGLIVHLMGRGKNYVLFFLLSISEAFPGSRKWKRKKTEPSNEIKWKKLCIKRMYKMCQCFATAIIYNNNFISLFYKLSIA